MSCRDVREALDALLDGEMDAGEEIDVRDHLDECPACLQELDDLREWHGTLADALAVERVRPSPAERRRTSDAVIAAIRRRSIPPSRWAALLAIGLSVGIVASAVALSRPPRGQVARVAEQIRQRESRDAELRSMSAEIEQDLDGARKVVAGRGADDPAARAVAVGTLNIARRLGSDPLEELRRAPDVARVISDLQRIPRAAECVSITRTLNGATTSVTQMNDGKIRVGVPGFRFEARNMEDLLAGHGELCRSYGIAGCDGFLSVGDSSAGADWKGRLNLLLQTGAWDEGAQWEAYRGWVAAKAPDAKEIERRLKAHQDRCRAAAVKIPAPPVPVDVEAILRDVKALTRAELQRTQERIDSEMKKLDVRLREAGELRARARGLRIFAEDVTRE
jgi:hypothetical protein